MNNYDMYLPSYSIGDHVFHQIESICLPYGTKAVVIGGWTAMDAIRLDLQKALIETKIELVGFQFFGGESSYANVEALMEVEAEIGRASCRERVLR